MKTIFAVLSLVVLSGCANTSLHVVTKSKNVELLQSTQTSLEEGVTAEEFIARVGTLKPGMSRKHVEEVLSITPTVSKNQLSTEVIRHKLYGEPRLMTHEDVKNFHTHVSSLCGYTLPIEASSRSIYLESASKIGIRQRGSRLFVDLIYECERGTLFFVQWHGNERLDESATVPLWAIIPLPQGIRDVTKTKTE